MSPAAKPGLLELPELRQFFAEIDQQLASGDMNPADTHESVAKSELPQFFADLSYPVPPTEGL